MLRGKVTINHINITKTTEPNGRAAVEWDAQAILFNSIAIKNNGAGKRIAVVNILSAQWVPPRYL